MKPAETQAVEKPQGELQTREHDPESRQPLPSLSAAERYDRVAKAAYLSCRATGLPARVRSFSDWLAAEAEVDKVRTQTAA